MRLPCNLRRIREAKGLSIRELAKRSGINRGQLSAIERGHALATDAWVPKLEEAYGVELSLWYEPQVLAVLVYPESASP